MIHSQNSQITLMCSNLADAVQFYSQVLGFKIERQYGEHYAELLGAGIRIGLHPSNSIQTGNNIQLGLEVNNMEEAKKLFAERKISYSESEEPGIKLLHFKDLDGNLLYLMARQ